MGLQSACACRWLAGAYFMLVTMLSVGYGDITPHTNPEIIVCMFALIAGIIFFGILLGSIAEALNVSASHALSPNSGFLHTALFLRPPRQQCYQCCIGGDGCCGHSRGIAIDKDNFSWGMILCCIAVVLNGGHIPSQCMLLTAAVHLTGIWKCVMAGCKPCMGSSGRAIQHA